MLFYSLGTIEYIDVQIVHITISIYDLTGRIIVKFWNVNDLKMKTLNFKIKYNHCLDTNLSTYNLSLNSKEIWVIFPNVL